MAREKQYCEIQVLERVADVFSARGYQGTSLAMLLDATGLGKQSLYNSFGDKRALYLKSIECSSARYANVQAMMQRAENGKAAVIAFFEHVLANCASGDAARKSCIVSAGLLEGIDDELIARTLREKWLATHEVMRAAVERGQKDGSVANTSASALLADVLLNILGGLRVSARANFDKVRLNDGVRLALTVLDLPMTVESTEKKSTKRR